MKAFSLLPPEVWGLHCECGKGHMAWGARVAIYCGIVPQPSGRIARRDSSRTWAAKVSLLLNGAGKLMTDDVEKAEVFCAAFASVTTSKTSMQEFRPLRLGGKSGTLVVEDWGRVHFTWNSVSLTDCTQVLRELANAIAGPLLFIFEWPGIKRCSSRLEKRKYHSAKNQEGRFGNLLANQLHLSPW